MRVAWILSGLVLAGCSNRYVLSSPDGLPVPKLSRQASAYVALPANGSYEAAEYASSGTQTAKTLCSALERRLGRVVVGQEVEPYELALASARRLDSDYLFLPVIEHWEERATEWSGRPDRIQISVFVYDVADGSLISSVQLSGRSRWVTFGGDHPEELLAKPVEEYVATLF